MASPENTTGTVYSVSGLTAAIKHLLEKNFPIIWIEGEISNFRTAGSGHYYFTLKDDKAGIGAVMFAGQHRHLKFIPEDGLKVTGLGRISVYEPRGTYQIILEHMMPKGAGELLIAFEQLKKRLGEEGLFDPARKKPIPFMPATIGIISSPAGAVVHDIIQVATRRFPGLRIQIFPVAVQGKNAAREIAEAVALANQRAEAEVLVIARGGGSLEDLAPFNSEIVARAVYGSVIPVISAVGHETDFTICDFVADLRAPTPSAAAELMVPVRQDLLAARRGLHRRLVSAADKLLRRNREMLSSLLRRLADPRRHVQDIRLRLDDLMARMERMLKNSLRGRQTRLDWLNERLTGGQPARLLEDRRRSIELARAGLTRQTAAFIREKRHRLHTITATLTALDPTAVLERGYSIARTIPGGRVITTPLQVSAGDNLELRVARGIINCQVKPDRRETP
ncbi:MAG: exodeoxyribonuclease VII large subunit [Thermodesulfobacteriota bacterium]